MSGPSAIGPVIETPRLLLRRWRESDREPFAAINGDPEVMRLFPAPLSRAESDALIDAIEAHFEATGFGLWAVEIRDGPDAGTLAGFDGLYTPPAEMPFAPAVEVGWRLARSTWGHGYATEAALASVRFGFDELGLEEIVSFTSSVNTRSQAVMERIGMERDPDGDFEHPLIPAGQEIRPHVLYRLRAT